MQNLFFFKCNTGVRQGENLSLLLFTIYLNDFEKYSRHTSKGLDSLASKFSEFLGNDVEVYIRLYVVADDTIVMA